MHPKSTNAMPSRTFPLSRQRRRPAVSKNLVPVQDGGRLAAPRSSDPMGHRDERPDAERHSGPESGASPPAARLPHENDEHTDVPHAPRRPIIQAEEDLNNGLRDTDRRGDAARVFDEANREPRKRR